MKIAAARSTATPAALRRLGIAGSGALALAFALAAPSKAPAAVTETFAYTGGEQIFIVPAGITSVEILAVGGKGAQGGDTSFGGGNPGDPGFGARVTGTLAVAPGDVLYLEVGGNGTVGGLTPGSGGFNGGGSGGGTTDGGNGGGGGGGGASDVRTCSRFDLSCPGGLGTLETRLLVAGGGGGGGAGFGEGDGAAGGNAGQPGGDKNGVRGTAFGGGAGTASAGGDGGASNGQPTTTPGASGSLGAGGSGGDGQYAAAGGAGAGLYGGGGGGGGRYYGAGGGGGGDLVPAGGSSVLDASGVPQISVTYGPLAPVLSATDPASPGRTRIPKVIGSAEPGATINLYQQADCSRAIAGTGTAAELEGAGVAIAKPVARNATTPIAARAVDADGNVSACSNALDYTHDSVGPAAPVLDSTDPASPSQQRSPTVFGSAEDGTTVKLYNRADCARGEIGAGSAAELAAGIAVSKPLARNATTPIAARAFDSAGNASACSAALDYTHDSIKPAAPTLSATDPDSPSPEANPRVLGSAEAGATIRLYLRTTCAGGLIGTGTTADLEGAGVAVSSDLRANRTVSIAARAIDAAGNVSECSNALTYTREADCAAPGRTSPAPGRGERAVVPPCG